MNERFVSVMGEFVISTPQVIVLGVPETNETFRAKGVKSNFRLEVHQGGVANNDAVRYIDRSLPRNALNREDGCLTDIKLQASIFFEDGLRLENLRTPFAIAIWRI